MEESLTNLQEMTVLQELKNDTKPIYTAGLLRILDKYLSECDIENAKKMFACHREEAMKAIAQYNPTMHRIMGRRNKKRVELDEYETNKLPRCIQRVANNTGAFFMFANNLKFTIGNKPNEAQELQPYFELFLDFLKKHYFHEKMYEARRIAGAETECAKEYVHYRNQDGETEVLCRLHSNSEGKTLYSLFDEYGKMMAFGISYFLRDTNFEIEEHFDVYTSKFIWRFNKVQSNSTKKWFLLEKRDNVFKKIPIIYYHHEVDWHGAQERIERLEWVDSKRGDTNEYFGDPYLVVTADVVNNRLADAREVGKVIVMDGADGKFEFIAPPDCGDMIQNEKDDLKGSIEQDTLTPDWSYKSIMGLGTLSGEAMRRANLPGYVKRTNFAVQVYNELIQREINLILAIMCNYEYLGNSEIQDGLKRLKIEFQYTDPFVGGIEDNSVEIATLVGAGVMSIRAAVDANRHIEDKDAEYERIWQEKERQALIEAKAKIEAEKITQQPTQQED